MKKLFVFLVFLSLALSACSHGDLLYVKKNSTSTPVNTPTQILLLATKTPVKIANNKSIYCIVIDLHSDNKTTVNIRSGPGMNYPAVGIAKNGENYQILSEQSGWLEINKNKFIYKDWCRYEKRN